MCIFSWTACFSSRSLFNITPSAASTKSTTPSQSLIAAVTSSEKFTWPCRKNAKKTWKPAIWNLEGKKLPGVSKTLSKYDFCRTSERSRVTGVAFMLTPRSCSVNKVSVYLRFFSSKSWYPGCVWRIKQSTKVVFPWCKCPTKATFRIREVLSMISAMNLNRNININVWKTNTCTQKTKQLWKKHTYSIL